MTHSDHVVAMETVSDGLLPCPFCGGAAHCGQDPSALDCNYAGCADPGCVGYNLAYDFVTLTFAIAAWNCRAPSELLASRLAKQASDGWVLVPKEPTREMWAAMGDALVGYRNRHHDKVAAELYAAMLAVAPSPVGGSVS